MLGHALLHVQVEAGIKQSSFSFRLARRWFSETVHELFSKEATKVKEVQRGSKLAALKNWN